jgi:hypothetical protein
VPHTKNVAWRRIIEPEEVFKKTGYSRLLNLHPLRPDPESPVMLIETARHRVRIRARIGGQPGAPTPLSESQMNAVFRASTPLPGACRELNARRGRAITRLHSHRRRHRLWAIKAAQCPGVVTGWIGPTHGDITADCVAMAFGVPIDTDPPALAILHEWVKTTGAEMNEAHLRMTRIPKCADLIQQGVGGASLLDRQCNRDGWRALDHAGDAR